MKAAQILKAKIASGQLTLGAFVIDHLWLGAIEICMKAGFDYVIIDGEHMSHGGPALADAFVLGRMTDFPLLYRPARTDATAIRNALDLGPCGLILPMIDTVEQLDDVREGAFMPPRGGRRPGGPGNRWPSDFQYETWKAEVEDDLIIIPQVESRKGLENAEALAAHKITTYLGVGPYDLSANLGCCWKPEVPALSNAIVKLRAAAERAGKTLWAMGDPAMFTKLGVHFVGITEPTWFLQAQLNDLVKRVRAAYPVSPNVRV